LLLESAAVQNRRVAIQLIEIALGLIPALPVVSDNREMTLRLFSVMACLLVTNSDSKVAHVLLTRYLSNILSGLMDLCIDNGGVHNDDLIRDMGEAVQDMDPVAILAIETENLPTPISLVNLLVDRVRDKVLLRTFLAVLESRGDAYSKRFCGEHLTTIILRENGVRHFLEEFVRINSFHGIPCFKELYGPKTLYLGLEHSHFEKIANLLSAVPARIKSIDVNVILISYSLSINNIL
jgi:hypothetical protein